MRPSKRIAALRFIQRKHKYEIDAIASKLGALRAQVSEIQAQEMALQRNLAKDTRVNIVEAAPYLANYLAAVKRQQLYLGVKKSELEEKCRDLEERLFDKYSEAKSDEAPLNRALSDLRTETLRVETRINDEIAQYGILHRKRNFSE